MTQLPRRQQNRLNCKRAILDAALKVFAAEGNSGGFNRRSGRRGGVTKPTLKSYFSSMHSPFQAMILGKRDETLDVFEHPSDQGMVADPLTFDWAYADPASRFATVAMTDINGLLRGQMMSAFDLESIAGSGMGMTPAQLSLDPTDVLLNLLVVNDDTDDFHDGPLILDPSSARRMPWSKLGHDLRVLSNFKGPSAALCPSSILTKVFAQAAAVGLFAKYTLFKETLESASAKGLRNLTTVTTHANHDLLIYQAALTERDKGLAAICGPLKIGLAKMHEETGPGFMEACVGAGDGLATADQTVLLQNFPRVFALRHGKTAAFMRRWNEAADCQSIHLQISLNAKAGTPVF